MIEGAVPSQPAVEKNTGSASLAAPPLLQLAKGRAVAASHRGQFLAPMGDVIPLSTPWRIS